MKEKIKTFAARAGVAAPVGAIVAAASALPTMAAETVAPYVVTSDALAPIQTTINSAVTNTVPIGIGLMATMLGLAVVARVIYRFI